MTDNIIDRYSMVVELIKLRSLAEQARVYANKQHGIRLGSSIGNTKAIRNLRKELAKEKALSKQK